ncbi:hypothetical protein [Phenylobacterium sp.]|uniref:hypothetical protein n=1 Tax=Phenylobacterium sp. TaxID=1871053 RepID=UPI0025DD0276|nr:hypothetical protein [Phenylobacterium sp.]
MFTVILEMIAPNASTLRAVSLPRPLYVGAATVMGAAVLALSLSSLADAFLVRLLLFYAGTAAAYGLMPFVRRGDVPLVAAWVVLISELAPCITGQLISPIKVTADILGVAMATAPIFIARLRQVLQGDIRPAGRRATERL